MKESEIQKNIIDYLRIKGYEVFKHHSTGFTGKQGAWIPMKNTVKGISDIIACSPTGQFIAIEVKRPGGTTSAEQLDFIQRIIRKKGIALVAYSLDDVMRKL